MNKKSLPLALVLVLASSAAQATLVTFGVPGDDRYGGSAAPYFSTARYVQDGRTFITTFLDVSAGCEQYANACPLLKPSGYDNVAALTPDSTVAINWGGGPGMSFEYILDGVGGTFDLTSFSVASAWGTQTLYFYGFGADGQLLYEDSALVGLDAVLEELNWDNISRFVVEKGGDIVYDPDFYAAGDWGEQFVLGALVINENDHPLPEPGVLALLGVGLAGFGLSRRRKTA
ncbi:MAG: PEP-CTERM sorting domain-containing protein [Azoarcus sp.]|nr:PEP-CTERM sorting domain-containing protein [Azoarcus sp.]